MQKKSTELMKAEFLGSEQDYILILGEYDLTDWITAGVQQAQESNSSILTSK